jgi:hypothetical protein
LSTRRSSPGFVKSLGGGVKSIKSPFKYGI